MKKYLLLFLSFSILLCDVIPLSKKNIDLKRENEFSRGTFLIVLSNPDLYNSALTAFIGLKNTQGYDVEVISFSEGNDEVEGINGVTSSDLKNYLINFYSIQ